MSAPFTLDVGIEMAVLQALENLAARYDDPWHVVFDGGPATTLRDKPCNALVIHPAAMIGTAVDDVMVETLRETGAMSESGTCRHCGRRIINENGRWIDPEATGDDSVWRETCEAHDTFIAEHEPSR